MQHVSDDFYDQMAAAYHFLFDDWNAAIERQKAVLFKVLPAPSDAGTILDCACGIGTQSLGLAQAGYTIKGTDLSVAAIKRAINEASARGLTIAFRVDAMPCDCWQPPPKPGTARLLQWTTHFLTSTVMRKYKWRYSPCATV